jgi:hypothetical protein
VISSSIVHIFFIFVLLRNKKVKKREGLYILSLPLEKREDNNDNDNRKMMEQTNCNINFLVAACGMSGVSVETGLKSSNPTWVV